MPRSPLFAATLVALVLLAAILRLRGNDYLLPLLVEPDAHIAVQVMLIEEEAPDPASDVNYGSYPHVTAWTTIALSDPAAPISGAEYGSIDAHLEAARDPVRRVRTAVALLSLLAIPATWLLACRFVTRGWALVATGLVATSLLAVHFGAQARPHAAAMGFGTFALFFATRVARGGRWMDYLLASVAAGLCFGTLHSGIALGFPILAAHLVNVRQRGESAWRLGGKRAALLVIPAAALALTMVAFYPFLFAESGGRDAAQMEAADGRFVQAGHDLIYSQFNGRGFGILTRMLWSWEPTLFVTTSLAALVFLATRMRRDIPRAAGADVVVALAFALPYLAVNGMYQMVYERFLIPMVPLLAVFSAWGLSRLSALRPPTTRRLAAGIGAVALAFPALVSWRLTELRVAPDTMELAGQWLSANGDPTTDRVLVTRGLCLPLFETVESDIEEIMDVPPRKTRLTWTEYQQYVLQRDRPAPTWNAVWMPVLGSDGRLTERMASDPQGYVDEQHGQWLVAEVYADGRMLPGLCRVHEVLRASGEPLARFSPDGERAVSEHPLKYQEETNVPLAHFAWRVLRAERMGPVIEVMRPPYGVPPSER